VATEIITPDPGNILFQLAADLVNQSSSNIFLTGKAGTGKTTFLKYIRANCPKQMAVVAPTGVAAINAGGVTIHSFFQLPFAPFIPEAKGFSGNNEEVVSRSSLISRLRIAGDKLKVLRQLELLIIDEVSMVRSDTMDAIDTVLRHVRKRSNERFGGVQVLFIGDMFQLPPVVKDTEWRFLSDYYSSPYFFDSAVIREEPPVYIEFSKIYRQSEELFIRVLNQVRNNELDQEGMAILDQRFQPAFSRSKNDGYIVLTTHNEKARSINTRELESLVSPPVSYKADIKGEFPPNAFPAEEALVLKKGAQVMFIKNDSDRSKRYFNGKIGTVTRLETDKIYVQCKDEPYEIEVAQETWKNIRYTLNNKSRGMDEEELGSFSQYPLRLAWAITIHKSQGLTFEKAIIDAGEAFAAGQVYVALSRCTSLDGMILQSKVRQGSLFTDDRIVRFSKSCRSAQELQEDFVDARKNYHLKLLQSAFDFTLPLQMGRELVEYLIKHESSFNKESIDWSGKWMQPLNGVQATAMKFQQWLQAQFQQPGLPEENNLVQVKTKDGAAHFIKELQGIIGIIQQSPVQTDSRVHAKEFNESIRELFGELSLRVHLLKGIGERFNIEAWHKSKKSFVLPYFSVNAYAGSSEQKVESEHPQLYQQLKRLRDTICAKKDKPIYMVAGSRSLEQMVAYLPQTADELEQISGFGKSRIESYGQQFLEIIQQYCKDHNLSSRISEIAPKKKRKEPSAAKVVKPDTRAESFRLFKEGMTTVEIAQIRTLTRQTIEGHLAHYVEQGLIDIRELISNDKIEMMEPLVRDYDGGTINPIKEKLGDHISYGEIRLMIAWLSFKRASQQEQAHPIQ
jgi:hypothetical protein